MSDELTTNDRFSLLAFTVAAVASLLVFVMAIANKQLLAAALIVAAWVWFIDDRL